MFEPLTNGAFLRLGSAYTGNFAKSFPVRVTREHIRKGVPCLVRGGTTAAAPELTLFFGSLSAPWEFRETDIGEKADSRGFLRGQSEENHSAGLRDKGAQTTSLRLEVTVHGYVAVAVDADLEVKETAGFWLSLIAKGTLGGKNFSPETSRRGSV